MKGYWVYFYYNIQKEIIYVGQSINVGARYISHSRDYWFDEIHSIGIRQYPNMATMDVYEHYYILKLLPKYNNTYINRGGMSNSIPDESGEILYLKKDFIDIFCGGVGAGDIAAPESVAISNGAVVIEDCAVNLLSRQFRSLDINSTIWKFLVDPQKDEYGLATFNEELVGIKNIKSQTKIHNNFITDKYLRVNTLTLVIGNKSACIKIFNGTKPRVLRGIIFEPQNSLLVLDFVTLAKEAFVCANFSRRGEG